MEEDVNLKFDGYDEDLNENPFFKYIKTKNKPLYDEVADNRWIICVPRKGTLSRSNHTVNDVENHILYPHPLDKGSNLTDFKTLNGKTVKVNEGFIVTTEGFEDVKSVRILFEETFFNNNNESFQVLCLDQPLEGEIGVCAEPVVQALDNLQGCIDFLWPSTGSKQGQKQVDEIIKLFNSTYQQLEGKSLRHLIDAANAIYTRAMQGALKNSQLRRLTQNDKVYLDNVKLAIETYVIHGLYTRLMKVISSIVGNEDAALNKITRNLAEIQIRDLGIKPEFCTNLPRGRRILSFLNKFTSPLEKFHCLKKSITIITERKMKEKVPGTKDVTTADDLLPALVFLVIKSDIPNWLANIAFLHNFHFSKCGYNEFQFYLASLEAAVEHVRSGYVSSEFKGGVPFKRLQNGADGSPYLWHPVDHDNIKPNALDMLFEYTAEGNESEVEKLLANEENDNARLDQMCHPLCSCDKCEKLLSRRRNDPSAVTVFSRDDMGRTVLHVAAEYGHTNLIYSLIHKGAVVNAMDYHGSTPLHMACLRGHSKVVLILLHYKADANAPDNDGNTALHLCAANGHEPCCKSLIYADMHQHVLKINVANENGDTPLHLAARWGYVELVDLLLETGASVEARNKNKQTPLECATNQQVSESLLDVTASNIEKDTGFLNLLPEKTSSKSLQIPSNRQKRTSLAGSPANSLEREESKEVYAFLRTIVDGDIEMVRFRLNLDEEDEEDGGEEQCKSEEDLCHPLCQCEKCIKWQKLTQRSLERSVHVNCANEDGNTALHVAAVRGYTDITNLLLRHGANPNVKNTRKQQTPLHLACQYNHQEVAESLLKYQSKVNVKDYKGNTPLHFCCVNGNLAPALVLLEHKPNVDAQNDRGNTPLHEAARWNFVALVRVLLEHGASVTTRNKIQLTPMQYAKQDDVVKVLDDSGKFTELLLKDSARRNTWAGLSKDSKRQFDVSLANPVEAKASPPKTIPKPQAMKIYYRATPASTSNENTSNNTPETKDKETRLRSLTESSACGSSIVAPQTKMSQIFEQLERGEVEKLQEIAKAVRSFDRRKSLKRTVTVDKSKPLFPLNVDEEVLKAFDQSALRKTPLLFDQRIAVPSNTPELEAGRISPSPLLNRVRNVLIGSNQEPKPEGPLLSRIKNILPEDPSDAPCTVIVQEVDTESSSAESSIGKNENKQYKINETEVGVGKRADVGYEELASLQDISNKLLPNEKKEEYCNNISDDPKGEKSGDLVCADVVGGELDEAKLQADKSDDLANKESEMLNPEKSEDTDTNDSNDHKKESYESKLEADKSDVLPCAVKDAQLLNTEKSEDLVTNDSNDHKESSSKVETSQPDERVDVARAEIESVPDDLVKDSPKSTHDLHTEDKTGLECAETRSTSNEVGQNIKDDLHEQDCTNHDMRDISVAEERVQTANIFSQDDLVSVISIKETNEEPANQDSGNISVGEKPLLTETSALADDCRDDESSVEKAD
ncbi:ankyrin repeat domain-containing protein 27-like [Actinia tenebrosa]|uniref:Ankyrin repeat domain-containing protein 27-like n=1 Tax=Actinia tenebrosa TaxID=6105 RepID=A0A6P8IF64_ACTTE|nr:ankyrin repeat domain-containing protein 27-like [Actinia tenebrosa]